NCLPMSRADKAGGTEASHTSTRLSGSPRATFTYPHRTQYPPLCGGASPKRCESLIRFSILYRMTWIPLRKKRLLHKPREICRVLQRFSLRSARTPPTRQPWEHKFTKQSWSAALHKSSFG